RRDTEIVEVEPAGTEHWSREEEVECRPRAQDGLRDRVRVGELERELVERERAAPPERNQRRGAGRRLGSGSERRSSAQGEAGGPRAVDAQARRRVVRVLVVRVLVVRVLV